MTSTEFTMHGTIFESLTHLAQIGLARVLDGRLYWTRETDPQARVIAPGSAEECAAALADWGARRRAAGDWSQPQTRGKGFVPAVMSSRFGTNGTMLTESPDGDGRGWRWGMVYRQARECIDAADMRDRRTMGALGQPSYWSGKGSSPERGRHPWQMSPSSRDWMNQNPGKWRNQLPTAGEKLIEQILTGTGRRVPSAGWSEEDTNATLAMLAMEGIAVYPLARRVGEPTSTSAEMAATTVREIGVPLFAVPVSPARLTTVLQDRAWNPRDPWDLNWLTEQQVEYVVKFATVEASGGSQSSGRKTAAGRVVNVAKLRS